VALAASVCELSKRATLRSPESPQDLRTSYAAALDARAARDSNGRMEHDAAPARHAPLGPELGWATAAAAVAVLAAMGSERLFGYRDPSLLFITAVLVVSVRTRMSVAIYAAALCFLAYNFFFIHPLYTLYISRASDVATVLIFLAAALLCGRLANRLRSQVLDLRRANARTRALQKLSEGLAAAGDEAAVAEVATRAVTAAMAAEAVMAALDQRTHRLGPALGHDEHLDIDHVTRITAEACLESATARDPAAATRLDFGWWCHPLWAGDRALGALFLRFAEPLSTIAPAQASLAQAMAQIVAQALARARLSHQLEAAHVLAESERLRSALLSSVSHDLRSPLSTIIGSAESLKLYSERLSEEDKGILAGDILGEGLRLDRYIQNLLDMTRLGTDARLKREWLGLDEICGTLLPRLRRSHPDLRVDLALGTPPPLLHVNPALIEQALFNLLDNAAKFSPPYAPLRVEAARQPDHWRIDVVDRGPGIPSSERERVFDMFHSVAHGDDGEGGTGLGLAISQGILAAHGGSIAALPGDEGVGTIMRLSLPLAEPPA
jgi:two-component system sensor histidine kinase KdpD